MRNKDFSKKVKAEALRMSSSRCERCWSSQNLKFQHRVPIYQEGASDLNNCIVLCSKCYEIVPEDQSLLKIFMEFASPKEMINYYGVKTEIDAIEEWCNEEGISTSETLRKSNIKSHKNSVMTGMKKKANKGEICGFNAPFGYKFENGNLEIIQKEAQIVKQIFNQYQEEYTLREIVRFLNSNGIKTKKNNKWSIWAVRRILKNPIYVGYVRWNNIIKKGKHSLVIEPQQFNHVQTQMSKRAKRRSPHRVLINDG
jgi:hypothetical protein